MPFDALPDVPVEVVNPRQLEVDIARSMRRLLARGWLQGSVGGPGQGYCLIGAAGRVATRNVELFEDQVYIDTKRRRVQAAIRVLEEMGSVTGYDAEHVFLWNDHSDRTKGEVLAALDATIARLEA